MPISHGKHTCLSWCDDATLRCAVSKLISYIMYCIGVWGGCGTTQKKRVQKILNHCARVVFSVRKFKHVSALLEELQWASVDRRVCERDIAMVHQLLNSLYAPQCLRNCISYRVASWRVRQRYSGSCHWTAAAAACPHWTGQTLLCI